MKSPELTFTEVRSLFTYTAATGALAWRVQLSRRVRVGDAAGKITTNGYRRVRINGLDYQVHRLVWLYVHGRWPAAQIDHIDGDRLNNRSENLREADASQNSFNTKSKPNATGFKGVKLHRGKYEARIRFYNKTVYLGSFGSAQEAGQARATAAIQYHGEFARAA